MKPAKLGWLRFTPWIVSLLAMLSITLWYFYRSPGSPAAGLLGAGLFVGQCNELAEMAVSAISAKDEAALGQVAAASARLRGELSKQPPRWFPNTEVRALLDEIDTQVEQNRLALQGEFSGELPDPLRLRSASQSLQDELRGAFSKTDLHSPSLWGLAPGDFLLAAQGFASLLALMIWAAASFREPLDYLEREKRDVLQIADHNSQAALSRCYELSREFLETAQRILERESRQRKAELPVQPFARLEQP